MCVVSKADRMCSKKRKLYPLSQPAFLSDEHHDLVQEVSCKDFGWYIINHSGSMLGCNWIILRH